MPNINKNIIMQAGAAVANATNKAAGLSASTPEPGSIISAIQLVNGGRSIGPAALAHFTESVRNKLLSLQVDLEPIQSGSGTPSPDNVRPISGRTGLNVYVSPTQDVADATTYAVDWTTEAGTVYGGTVDVVTGVLTVDRASVDMGTLNWAYGSAYGSYFNSQDIKNLVADTYECLSDRFKNIPMSSTAITNNDWAVGINCNGAGGGITGAAAKGAVVATCKQYTDAATFKTAMSGVQLCYELATPLTYQLTGQDVVTLVGDNYIWSDSGDVTITE